MRKLAYSAFSISAAFFISEYLVPDGKGFAFAAVSLLLLLPAVFLKGNRRLAAIIVSLSLAFGFMYYQFYCDMRYGDAGSLYGEKTVTVTAKAFPKEKDYGASLEVEYKSTGGGKLRGMLFVYDESYLDIVPGDELTLEARISDSGLMRGEETHFYYAKGISFLMSQRGEISVKHRNNISIFDTALYISDAITNKIREIFSDDRSGAFAAAIAMGDTSGLYDYSSDVDDLKLSGIYHIVSVSGMHMAFLVWFSRALLGKSKISSCVIIAIIMVFTWIVGFAPCVVRAAIMQILIIAASLVKRESDTLTSLSVALCLILLVNPSAAADVGLQLSFGATLGLFTVSDKVYNACDRFIEALGLYEKTCVRIPLKAVIGSFAASIGACAFTVPLNMLYFGYLSIVSPITNILTFWIMPIIFCGVFVCTLIGSIFLPLGTALAALLSLLIEYVFAVSGFLGNLPFAALFASGLAVSVWMAAVYISFIVMFFLGCSAGTFMSFTALSASMLCIILVLTNYMFMHPSSPRVTAFNVGQGASTLISYNGRNVLIDCGSTSGEDAGETVSNYLGAYMCRDIDVIVLTHFHEDHFNGIIEVIERIGAKTIIAPEALLSDADEYILLDDTAKAYGVEIITAENDLTVSLGDADMTIFAPVGQFSENERGLSVLYTYNDYDIIITGDMSSTGELMFLNRANLPDTELLIVGHHGSKYSTSDAFLDEISPEKAVISVGYNTYGHPDDEVLSRLEQRDIEVYRTDISGNITIYAE